MSTCNKASKVEAYFGTWYHTKDANCIGNCQLKSSSAAEMIAMRIYWEGARHPGVVDRIYDAKCATAALKSLKYSSDIDIQ